MVHAPDILKFWRSALIKSVQNENPDLTQRQMAILLLVYTTEPPHTVRGLAKELGVAKPVITRALDSLGKLDYLKRKKDETDRRSIMVQRTVAGSMFLSEFSDNIVTLAGAPIH